MFLLIEWFDSDNRIVMYIKSLCVFVCWFRHYTSSSHDDKSNAFTAISVILDNILDYIDSGVIVGVEHLVSKSNK